MTEFCKIKEWSVSRWKEHRESVEKNFAARIFCPINYVRLKWVIIRYLRPQKARTQRSSLKTLWDGVWIRKGVNPTTACGKYKEKSFALISDQKLLEASSIQTALGRDKIGVLSLPQRFQRVYVWHMCHV